MKPRSPAQLESARRNGRSLQVVRPYPRNALRATSVCGRGPITTEGKRRSSRNATTHGLLARTIVLPGESNTRFQNLVAELLAEHQPRTSTEMALVETMIVNRWRRELPTLTRKPLPVLNRRNSVLDRTVGPLNRSRNAELMNLCSSVFICGQIKIFRNPNRANIMDKTSAEDFA